MSSSEPHGQSVSFAYLVPPMTDPKAVGSKRGSSAEALGSNRTLMAGVRFYGPKSTTTSSSWISATSSRPDSGPSMTLRSAPPQAASTSLTAVARVAAWAVTVHAFARARVWASICQPERSAATQGAALRRAVQNPCGALSRVAHLPSFPDDDGRQGSRG